VPISIRGGLGAGQGVRRGKVRGRGLETSSVNQGKNADY